MRIWLDPVKLSAYKLTPQDVHQALQNESVELPPAKSQVTIPSFLFALLDN